jgi:hypothetical protein
MELRCTAVKTRLLARPAATAASVPPGRACSTCAAGGSSATRPAWPGATSGRLRGLRTKVGAASSSSSSSTILTSQRRLGARLSKVDPWPITGPAAAPVGAAPTEVDSTAISLLPTTLSSVVGAGRSTPSSLLVYRSHRAASTAGGSTPAGCSIPGASDTYTVARSTSPIYNKNTTSY